MPESSHPLDSVADELTKWLDTESTYYANALRYGGRAPFAAPANDQQKLEYYRRKMFMENPDGSIAYDKPNTQGRSEIMQLLGPQGYAQVYDGVRPKAGLRSSEPVQQPAPEPMTEETA